MTTAELHTLTGAYALHALADDEREAFERHLGDCAACAQEVRELSATAARLGLAVAVTPPAGFREQVLRRVTTVRQEPPRTSAGGVGAPAASHRRPLAHWALAACLAAAASLGGVAVWQHEQADRARQEARAAERQADQVAQVLSAPDAKVTSARLAGGARGSVVVSHDRDRAVFVAAGMAAPPGGKVYQLWFDDGGHMRPAGLMDPARADQTVLMKGPVGDASGMGVTVEPAGGSEQPTSPPVALMSLPA
ncbi:anti-sigma factor [Streptomyces sp. NPDC052225]|uniref:anti-sigma factor n=1 Tax=Streptomyces sp. NPDC052225 TaxID=3154949 RepID=UPI00343B0C18